MEVDKNESGSLSPSRITEGSEGPGHHASVLLSGYCPGSRPPLHSAPGGRLALTHTASPAAFGVLDLTGDHVLSEGGGGVRGCRGSSGGREASGVLWGSYLASNR